jgi:hypothetical protein
MTDLAKKKKFDDALRFIKSVNLGNQILYDFLNTMNNNQDVSKAADFIIQCKLPFSDFP